VFFSKETIDETGKVITVLEKSYECTGRETGSVLRRVFIVLEKRNASIHEGLFFTP
jgi:hypothetical protein